MVYVDSTVAIVGAGMSGLIAARDLHGRGIDVVVLEAANRVGGRMLAETSALGSRLDLGGQWIGHDHHRFIDLADEFGLTRFPTHTPNKAAVVDDGRRLSAASAGVLLANSALVGTEILSRLPVPERWAATPLRSWIDRLPSDRARRILDLLIEATCCVDPAELSVAAFLSMVRHEGGLATMMKTLGGAQDSLITEGAATLTERLAADLGPRVRTGCEVTGIRHSDDGVSLTTESDTIRARKAVVTVPAPMAANIDFQPALPPDRVALQRNTRMGSVYKAIAVFERPFWRAHAEAESIQIGNPGYAVFDSSAPGGPGHLCILAAGRTAHQLDGLGMQERQAVLLEGLVPRLGNEVTNPADWHEKSWHQDAFAGGGYAALPLLGARDGSYPHPSAPTGNIHWAGTETAAEHAGYIEGAIAAGNRVADEITSGLQR